MARCLRFVDSLWDAILVGKEQSRMEILFERTGGLATFPGLNQPAHFDTRLNLSGEMTRVEELLHVVLSMSPWEPQAENTAPATDGFTYTITVIDGDRTRQTLTFKEPIMAPVVREMVSCLETLSKRTRLR